MAAPNLSVRRFLSALLALLAILPTSAGADVVRVALAANFAQPAKPLLEAFARATGHQAIVSSGSTGKLYAQIRNGAPFDILLAADSATPARLVEEKLAIAGSRSTYAIGRLVLWSRQAALVDATGAVLARGQFRHLAIANPSLAPYGGAALEVLGRLGLRDVLAPKLVQGENIAQTYQFVASGNAELGFVALSQVLVDGAIRDGSGWIVPRDYHGPIRQDVVILATARDNRAANALLEFLAGEAARRIIRAYGYDTEG